MASGCRYCQRKWNDSNGISVATQSSRHQSESSVSSLPLRQTFTPVKLLVAWQFGAKYYLLTKIMRVSSPTIFPYVT
ncbi:hypothetical protein R515_07210 [Salmonella enterica subsp. arizonae serovar 41:z4,z23:-]|nr:hypothetical protein R515_07210 [Salmonella enterica subsp. arizonae serovar 41:z4,z23:-]